MTTTGYDTYRESVAGRADVEDTPELVAYYRELERLKTAALWTVANKIEPWQPKSESVPVLWRYRELREHVLRSVSLVTPEEAGRGGDLRGQRGGAGRWGRRRLAVLGTAGDAPGRGGLGARALDLGVALHHGRARGLHDRGRPQDDAGGQRLRAHAQRVLARARGAGRRADVHLAGRAGHPAGQRAGGGVLRRAPGSAPGGGAPGGRLGGAVGRAGAAAARREVEQAVLAAVQVPVGADVRGAAAAGGGQRRQPF